MRKSHFRQVALCLIGLAATIPACQEQHAPEGSGVPGPTSTSTPYLASPATSDSARTIPNKAAAGNHPLKYTFDPTSRSCVDAQENLGFNEGEVVQCGRVSGRILDGQDFSGQDLRGLILETGSCARCNFDRADLRNARFDLPLLKVSFDGALLQDAFIAWNVNLGSFTNAVINANTRIQGLRFDHLTDHQIVFETPAEPSKRTALVSRGLSPMEQSIVLSDLGVLDQIQFDHEPRSEWYTQILGNKKPLDFFSQRINAIHPNVHPEDPLALAYSPGVMLIEASLLMLFPQWILNEYPDNRFSNMLKEVVQNLSDLEYPAAFFTSLKGVPINLGNQYLDAEYGSLYRAASLEHEARHADCALESEERAIAERKVLGEIVKRAPQVNSKREWYELQNQLGGVRNRLYQSRNHCMHFHAQCPADFADHPLRNKPACDGHAWGAYSVGGILMREIQNHCVNCTEAEKQVARATAADSFSRVLVLESMIKGTAPAPYPEEWNF